MRKPSVNTKLMLCLLFLMKIISCFFTCKYDYKIECLKKWLMKSLLWGAFTMSNNKQLLRGNYKTFKSHLTS